MAVRAKHVVDLMTISYIMNMSSVLHGPSVWGADPREWSTAEGLVFGAAVVFGQIALDGVLEVLFNNRFIGKIPVSGHHLDALGAKDIAFICFNRTITALFSYHLLLFCLTAPKMAWGWPAVRLTTTVVPYLLFFVMYDAGYHTMTSTSCLTPRSSFASTTAVLSVPRGVVCIPLLDAAC